MSAIRAITETTWERRLPLATRIGLLFAAVILVKPFSNLFLTWGVRDLPAAAPLLVLGVLMQTFWLLGRMALLSVVDLSVVLPITATGYVISAVLGYVFLHEHVTAIQWAGTLLIFSGAALTGSAPKKNSNANTVEQEVSMQG